MQNGDHQRAMVLTGFLCAGKTTLLNRMLIEQHRQKYIFIVNESGEDGIDNDLVPDIDEELFEINKGCICRIVHRDLIRILGGLFKRVVSGHAALKCLCAAKKA